MEASVLHAALGVLGILPPTSQSRAALVGPVTTTSCAWRTSAMRSPLLDLGRRTATAGRSRLVAMLRVLSTGVVLETDPGDVVLPALRNYPYGPPAR